MKEQAMRPYDVGILLMTAAMWGASFMFMRIIAPVTGWVWAAELRVLIGGALVAVMLHWQRQSWNLARDYPHYLVLGLINSAVPFALFALAALYIPAAYSALGNATAPMWSAVLSAVILGDKLNWPKAIGLLLGLIGVDGGRGQCHVIHSCHLSGGRHHLRRSFVCTSWRLYAHQSRACRITRAGRGQSTSRCTLADAFARFSPA